MTLAPGVPTDSRQSQASGSPSYRARPECLWQRLATNDSSLDLQPVATIGTRQARPAMTRSTAESVNAATLAGSARAPLGPCWGPTRAPLGRRLRTGREPLPTCTCIRAPKFVRRRCEEHPIIVLDRISLLTDVCQATTTRGRDLGVDVAMRREAPKSAQNSIGAPSTETREDLSKVTPHGRAGGGVRGGGGEGRHMVRQHASRRRASLTTRRCAKVETCSTAILGGLASRQCARNIMRYERNGPVAKAILAVPERAHIPVLVLVRGSGKLDYMRQ